MTNINKATDCYKQVLAKDANNYVANYQLGIVSYDKAEIVQIEKGEIYPWEDRDGSQIAAKDKEIKAYCKESSEWFEKAHKAKPTEYDPLQNLKMLYYRLGDTANWNRVNAELDKLKSGEVIASASDNTAKTTTQTTNNVSSASATSTATSNNTTQNNNNRRVSSNYMAAVMLWKIVGEVASTVKEAWDSRGSYSSSSSYSSGGYSSSNDSYSSSSSSTSDPKEMNESDFKAYWESHTGTKISFKLKGETYGGYFPRTYDIEGTIDSYDGSKYVVYITSVSRSVDNDVNAKEALNEVQKKYERSKQKYGYSFFHNNIEVVNK